MSKTKNSTPLGNIKSDISEENTNIITEETEYPVESTTIADSSDSAPQEYDEKGKPIEPASPESTFRDKKLEFHSMTKKEKREEKRRIYREYTSEMTSLQKVKYFIDYYKWYILLPIFVIIFAIYIGNTIYKNSRPVALSYAVLNCEEPDNFNNSFQEEYAEQFNLTGDYRFNSATNLKVTYDYFKEHEEYITTSNSTDYNVLKTQCELNDYDVIIGNADGIKYCTTQDITTRLKGFLDVNAYAALEPYMAEFENSYGGSDYFAIDISGTDFAKDLNLGYDDVYIAFPSVESSNKKNALQLLEYILDIDLIEE